MSIARPLSQESTMIEFEGKAKSPLNVILIYVSLFIAIGFVVFILLAQRSVNSQAQAAEQEKIGVQEELSKPSYADVISESKAFESAVNSLNELSAKKVSKAEILKEFYASITKDVRLNSFSISDEGILSLDGASGSYRAVADFIVGLKSFKRASDVKLISVSMNPADGVGEKERFVFSASAKINLDKIEVKDEAESDDGSSTQTNQDYTTDSAAGSDNSDIIEPSDTTADTTVDNSTTSTTSPDAEEITDNSYEGY